MQARFQRRSQSWTTCGREELSTNGAKVADEYNPMPEETTRIALGDMHTENIRHQRLCVGHQAASRSIAHQPGNTVGLNQPPHKTEKAINLTYFNIQNEKKSEREIENTPPRQTFTKAKLFCAWPSSRGSSLNSVRSAKNYKYH